MQTIGIHAAIVLLINFVFIGFSFRAIRALDVERFLRRGHTTEARILLVFLAIALGATVSSFVVTLLDQSLNLQNLFL